MEKESAMNKRQTKSPPLYLKIREYLLKAIQNMQAGNNRLETEEALSEKLGTSRATVREAMASLIREGYITRWQGKGNFGHPAVTKLPMRIDINSDFLKLIADSGEKPQLLKRNLRNQRASQRMLRRMPEVDDMEVTAFDWIYLDSRGPVIICDVELPHAYLRTPPSLEGNEQKLSAFLERHCRVHITYTTTWLSSTVDEAVADRFGIEQNRSMVVWEEIFYDLSDHRICFNTIYFHPDRIDLSMLLTI